MTSLLLLFLLLIVVVIVLFVAVVIWVVSMSREPIDATNAFVATLDDGDLPAAYESLCARTRLDYTLEEFTTHMSDVDRITDYAFVSASLRASEETLVSGTIHLGDDPVAFDFGLVEEGDTWKVCRYEPIDETAS